MALFNECMQWCAPKVLDTADIVRDGDLSPVETIAGSLNYFRFAHKPPGTEGQHQGVR
jgi:hypothetical protein